VSIFLVNIYSLNFIFFYPKAHSSNESSNGYRRIPANSSVVQMHFKLCNLNVQKFIFNCYQTVTLTEISAGNFWNTTWCCRGNRYVVAKFEFYCFVLTKTSYVLPVTNIFLTHPFVCIDYWWDNFGGFLLSKLKKSKQFTHVSWRHSEETFKKFIAVGLILYRYGGWRIAPPPPLSWSRRKPGVILVKRSY